MGFDNDNALAKSSISINNKPKADGKPKLLALSRLLNNLIDLIFPARCVGCGRVDSHWCKYCAAETAKSPAIIPLNLTYPLIASATTATHKGKLRRAINALKYENALPLGDVLAARLERALQQTNWTFDTIIPLPLHTQRQRERGYNQAYIIATALSKRVGVPVDTQAVTRSRNTRSQVGLSREERKMNVHRAFQANSSALYNHRVLIIDDVCTTGSTLISCAGAIHDAGANRVYALTVTAARVSPTTLPN